MQIKSQQIKRSKGRQNTNQPTAIIGIDLKNPFTMSNIKTLRTACKGSGQKLFSLRPETWKNHRLQVVEPIGIEPMTSSLQS